MKAFLMILFLAGSLHARRSVNQNYVLVFDVCPKSYPFAFDYGTKCCTKAYEGKFWSSNRCPGKAAYCPASKCEDSVLTCTVNCEYEYCVHIVKIGYMSREYNGDYYFEFSNNVEAHRPVYVKRSGGKCIWWHYRYRHWWVGPCENIGRNAGYAYLDEDYTCPFDGAKQTWRRGGSDQLIRGGRTIPMVLASAGAKRPKDLSGTAGVNAIFRNGRYKQQCRSVYRSKRFTCQRNN